MANNTLLTPRVKEVLGALERGPRTALQLLTESETFAAPYKNLNFLRRNLQKYADAGWVRSWRYATADHAALNYYKLTRDGYRLLRGGDGPQPSASYFAEVPVARQEHTRSLADVIVHACVAGHHCGIRLASFHAENQLTLHLADEYLKPDFQMTLRSPTDQQFRFLVELDNGTEPLAATDPHRESIRRKVTFYERFQDHWFSHWKQSGRRGFPPRFRVLFFARTALRVREILAVAASHATWRNRRLCYAATVQDFLAESDVLRSAIFLDHLGHWQSLVNIHPVARPLRPPVQLPEPVHEALFAT
jgi:hypothetical protein